MINELTHAISNLLQATSNKKPAMKYEQKNKSL